MEIGGYFGLESFPNNEYYSDLIPLNTGRNALAYLIRTKGIEKLHIPEYLCDSVYRVCEREGCSFEFYETDRQFRPIFDKSLRDGEWIYIVNYYGQITDASRYRDCFGRIIFDNAQAFFQKPEKNVDTIYSCRKFFGVPDGAYLSTDIKMTLPEDSSMGRMTHLMGRYEDSASSYYAEFVSNEESLYDLDVKMMSKITHNLLGAISYDRVKEARECNYNYIHNKLSKKNPLELIVPEGPYMYPFYCEKGKKVKEMLAKEQIYIPTLWPIQFGCGETAKDFSENILPIPCDQRYTQKEIDIVLEELLNII